MNAKTVLTLLAVSYSISGFANPLYEVVANDTNACGMHGCARFQKGYKFEALNWAPNAPKVPGRSLPTGKANEEPETYEFEGASVEPILDSQGKHVEPTCQWPIGGMMQHTVVGPNGQLYLKRVEVVTKCVNGKMTTIQRALN